MRPFVRILVLPSCGGPFLDAGRGDYYGWRWWIGVGRFMLLLGRARL